MKLFSADPSRNAFNITGHAIISVDGMIADGVGEMPDGLRVDADWEAFQQELNESDLVVLGRKGHERHENPGRRRLVLTRAVAELETDPADPLSTLWNPEGMPFARVLSALGLVGGTIAVTGGKDVFDHFVPAYDTFWLSEVHDLIIPHGRSCFSGGHPRELLAKSGLAPARTKQLDANGPVTATVWERVKKK